MSAPPVIFLLGFMGSGKSAIGRELARRLDVPFADLDERIESAVGASIATIFAEQGEAAFRGHESRALHATQALYPQGIVIATGGGVVTDPANLDWMSGHGRTVWLDASLDAIEARVSRDGSRPLFGDRAALEQLLAGRRPAYARAQVRVDTTVLNPPAAAEAILRALGLAPAREATS